MQWLRRTRRRINALPAAIRRSPVRQERFHTGAVDVGHNLSALAGLRRTFFYLALPIES